jgi:anti-anti-sigma factor
MSATVNTRAEGASLQITLSGEIDLANAASIEHELRTAVSHQTSAISVDLTALTYMDSTGIRILFAFASRLKPLRIILHLIVPLDSPTRRLIELSGLESLAVLQPKRQ